jgi:hypothetical protein
MVFIWSEFKNVMFLKTFYFDFKISITNPDFPETSADFQSRRFFFNKIMIYDFL